MSSHLQVRTVLYWKQHASDFVVQGAIKQDDKQDS